MAIKYKYNIGDIVTIKPNLKAGKTYSKTCSVIYAMTFYRGMTTYITKRYDGFYSVACDNSFWLWTDNMFVNHSNRMFINLESYVK